MPVSVAYGAQAQDTGVKSAQAYAHAAAALKVARVIRGRRNPSNSRTMLQLRVP